MSMDFGIIVRNSIGARPLLIWFAAINKLFILDEGFKSHFYNVVSGD